MGGPASRDVRPSRKRKLVPKKVMVLEDEAILVELLQDLLGLEGYEVSKPESAGDLLADLRSTRPDAVLMDVNLKGANGLELLGEIRAEKDDGWSGGRASYAIDDGEELDVVLP